ncbi:MAG: hypothetical protein AB1736_02385 [Chloroflexota bacterium]
MVVFAGNFESSGRFAAPGARELLQDAVCVTFDDDTYVLYSDVSREGARLP